MEDVGKPPTHYPTANSRAVGVISLAAVSGDSIPIDSGAQ